MNEDEDESEDRLPSGVYDWDKEGGRESKNNPQNAPLVASYMARA